MSESDTNSFIWEFEVFHMACSMASTLHTKPEAILRFKKQDLWHYDEGDLSNDCYGCASESDSPHPVLSN